MTLPPDLQVRKGEDFGPDPSLTNELPKAEKASAKSALGNLGLNTKPRSGIRKLTGDDREYIVNAYVLFANMARTFHPRFATALTDQSEFCADAWMELAEKNDTVRRNILAFIEGGGWGKVFVAHVPVLMAVLPEKTLEKMLERSMDIFGSFVGRVSDETEPMPA